ncbi:hypothetical protein EYF80_012847 [Liparis tanakae]|uniref:Uncharacterized protein n=1 Tax=Liparis tanakae TaxID=230148 RepID=A0A4Z2IH04_9TELE|nr:hypothetical protein EYF80_012847 [Liparis tanakae]
MMCCSREGGVGNIWCRSAEPGCLELAENTQPRNEHASNLPFKRCGRYVANRWSLSGARDNSPEAEDYGSRSPPPLSFLLENVNLTSPSSKA